MWYICTMEYYSAIKKDEIMATQMDLEIIILSEVSQTETSNQSTCCWDFPCSPLVKISCFQCRECRLDLWPGTKISHAMAFKKKKKKAEYLEIP